MGANQSKGHKFGGHGGQRLGGSADQQQTAQKSPQTPSQHQTQPEQPKPTPAKVSPLKKAFGGGPPAVSAKTPEARSAAAEAAERRIQASQARGTTASNPNQGQLASKVAKQNTTKPVIPQKEEERLVWD